MKTVQLSDLKAGTTTDTEYCTKQGELLIAKGTTLTQAHLEALKRRHVTELFTKDSSDDDEIQRLLSAEVKGLDELELDERRKAEEAKRQKEQQQSDEPAGALELPEFKEIKKGEEGLKQLTESKQSQNLDKKLSEGKTPDKPTGPALKEKAKEITPAERTEEYKGEVSTSYADALERVRTILRTLAEGKTVDGRIVRNVVESFVKTFITDKNILLNISSTKHSGDDYLFNHSLNVCLIAINIAASSSYSEEQVFEIGMGALLHDVGMMLIPKAIRTKGDKLNRDEWFEVQKHPILGLHILEKVTRLPESVPYVAYQSHERENGKGYPKSRSGRFIHRFAKIIQIADIFEALSSPRNYRSARIPYKSMETIIKMTRQGLVDGAFVKSFLSYTSLFPVGSLVELSDHRIGKVIQSNKKSFAKPMLSILVDEKGNLLTGEKIYQVDLAKQTDIQVTKAHKPDYIKVDIMEGF